MPDTSHRIDLVERCSFCGHACMGVVRIGKPTTPTGAVLEIDRPTFEEGLRRACDQGQARGGYAGLPSFLRDWNESKGWAEFGKDGEHVPLDALIEAIVLVHRKSLPDASVWQAILRFLEAQQRAGVETIWVVDD